MTLKQILTRHKGYVIATPTLREATNNRAISFTVLQTCHRGDHAKLRELLAFYADEGYDNVLIIPCYEDEDFPSDLAALFFRIVFGLCTAEKEG